MLIYKRGYIQNITSFFCHQQTSTKYWQFINLKTKGNKRAMALLYTCVDMGNKSVTRFWQPLRPPQISNMTSGLKSLTLITTYPCAYCWYSMGPYGSLWGHHSLQTSLKVKYVLSFEISDPNYLPIHVHIGYMVWVFLAACSDVYFMFAWCFHLRMADFFYYLRRSLQVYGLFIHVCVVSVWFSVGRPLLGSCSYFWVNDPILGIYSLYWGTLVPDDFGKMTIC